MQEDNDVIMFKCIRALHTGKLQKLTNLNSLSSKSLTIQEKQFREKSESYRTVIVQGREENVQVKARAVRKYGYFFLLPSQPNSRESSRTLILETPILAHTLF